MNTIKTKSQAMFAEGAQLGPLQTLSMKEWREKYKPGPRLKPLNNWGQIGREIDAKIEAALENDPRTVWTELETGVRRVIVNGWAYVNREAYYITEVPFDSMTDVIEVNV
jgi:hypothetical protein